MTYVIHNNIPVPADVRSTRASKYPFRELRVGECFLIPAEDIPPKGIGSVKAAVYAYKSAKRNDAKSKRFVVREIDHGDIGVWRIS